MRHAMLEDVALPGREIRIAWRTTRKHRAGMGKPRILAEKQGGTQSARCARMVISVRAAGMYGTIVLF